MIARTTDLPPALLGDATWWGTLAAARDLGSRGVSVTLASDSRLVPARWSRHVARWVRCPGKGEPERVLEWLLDFGKRSPGYVLYPTSDEIAWLVAANCGKLGSHYRLYSPPVEALACLLDKNRLGRAAVAAGLCAPETWCPGDEGEVLRIAGETRFPLYVKPRTNLFSHGCGKGQRVTQLADLLAAWRSWHSSGRFPQDVVERMPGIERPLIQATYARTDRIFTVDGFIDETGELACTLGCVKVLQLPRGSGPGICFQAAPVPGEIENGLVRLFREIGFFGVFDAEFIEDNGRFLLIDVNPRFYNHMAFEVERGLPLPWLAYLGAVGNREGLRAAVDSARKFRSEQSGPIRYVHRLQLRLLLGAQALTGGMNLEERGRWRRWLADREGRTTEPVYQKGDGWPSAAEWALELYYLVRHPHSSLRRLVMVGPRGTRCSAVSSPRRVKKRRSAWLRRREGELPMR